MPLYGNELSKTIQTVKPSVVAIGSFEKLRTPAVRFVGSGFVTGDGLSVITNAHVMKALGTDNANEVVGVITGNGGSTQFRAAVITSIDTEHDIAHLRLSGTPLPALKIGNSGSVREGQELAFTGFPLGMALGFNHVTHRATISSITPVTMPALDSGRLNPKVIAQLRNSSYDVFQLDGTAYPGNSGSPLYDPGTGEVLGLINKVMIKQLKESAISSPSGITYAIPSNFIRELLNRNKP